VVLVTGICLVTVLGILGIDINDSTSTRTVALGETPAKSPSASPAAPLVAYVFSPPKLGYVHGTNEFASPSVVDICTTIANATAGDQVKFTGTGAEGPLSATGILDPYGWVLLRGPISQLGLKTFTAAGITHLANGTYDPLALSGPVSINVQGGASQPCDPHTLPQAPAVSTTPATPSVPTPAGTETVTTTTNGFPWSLLVAGGLDLTLVGLAFRKRRDWEDGTYPDWTGPGGEPSVEQPELPPDEVFTPPPRDDGTGRLEVM
jgi:hypothetical protein